MPPLLIASCHCGRVALELKGRPIAVVACYCDDCQTGARQIEALPGAPRVRRPDGGTEFVDYRKDRVRVTKGADLLKALKLKPQSPTNRVVATCCNAAMVLNFDDSKHWVDVYRDRIVANAPAVEMRIFTKFAPDPAKLPADLPCHPRFSFALIARLMRAKIAMLIG